MNSTAPRLISCMALPAIITLLLAFSTGCTDAFAISDAQLFWVSCSSRPPPSITLRYSNGKEPDDIPDQSADDGSLNEKVNRRAEEIMVEKERERLEEANKQSFLKRKPRKLPYEDARRWVQANLGVDTEAEFHDLVANGNLRTPYIPKNPELYYTGTREWISWDHFLGGLFDSKSPSGIQPQTGFFD